MNIFKKTKKQNIIIIGCGSFGIDIADLLNEQNNSVTIIDIDESSFGKLSPSFNGQFITGDGTDIDLLQLAGAKDADILISSTNDDDTNILIAQIAKQVFNIHTIITRIYDSSKQISYSDMDIISICPTALSANECSRIVLSKENILV